MAVFFLLWKVIVRNDTIHKFENMCHFQQVRMVWKFGYKVSIGLRLVYI